MRVERLAPRADGDVLSMAQMQIEAAPQVRVIAHIDSQTYHRFTEADVLLCHLHKGTRQHSGVALEKA